MSPRPTLLPACAPKRLLRRALLCLCGAVVASSALAVGFGPAPESTAFGSNLELSIALRLEEGEIIPPQCLGADVHIGARQVPKAALKVVLEPAGRFGETARVLLHSAQAVDEPVVTVQLRVGCQPQTVRSFVVLADPAPLDGRVPAAPRRTTTTPTRLPSAMRVDASALLASTETRHPPPTARAHTAERPQPHQRTAPTVAKTHGSKAAAVAKAIPRLRLDEAEIAASATAASDTNRAADEAVAATTLAAAQHVADLERQMHALQDSVAAQQAMLATLRAKLAAAGQPGIAQQALALLVALLGAGVAWLGWRLRSANRACRADWQQAVAVSTSPAAEPAAAESLSPAHVAESRQTMHAMLAPNLAPMPLIAESTSEALCALLDDRPSSVEDLLDLEQQAEFFIMLGQDESAIDLLTNHLRHCGDASALPYLKLLEIHQRRDECEAFENVQSSFSQRFNADAVRWEIDLDSGLSLLDYPLVAASLQAAWSTPAIAMAELRTLLLRKDDDDLFDLPAYLDMLMLYAVARDLDAQPVAASARVEVALPTATHAPRPTHALIRSFNAFDGGVLDDRTAPRVDLDLSQAGWPPRDGDTSDVRVVLAETV